MSTLVKRKRAVLDWADVAVQKIADEVERRWIACNDAEEGRGITPEMVARWAQIIREADVDDRNGALKDGLRSLSQKAGQLAAKRDRTAKLGAAK